MKKFFTIFAVFSIFSFCAAADDFLYTIEPFGAVRFGQINEYVFDYLPNKTRHKLSMLNWEIQPEKIFGGRISGAWNEWELRWMTLGGIEGKSGFMYDFDYENGDEKATKYSQSFNRLTKNTEVAGEVSYAFDFGNYFALSPFSGFNYKIHQFEAWDGYYQYAAGNDYWNENLPKKDFTGRVVSYRHEMWYPTVGMRIGGNIYDFISFESSLSAAPYVWGKTKDMHWLRDLEIDNSLKNGVGFFGDIKVSVSFLKRHSISVFASAENVQNLSGKTTYTDIRKNTASTYDAQSGVQGGSSYNSYSIGISYKLSIW